MSHQMKRLHERAKRETAVFLDKPCWTKGDLECLWALMEIAYHARKEAEAAEHHCAAMGGGAMPESPNKPAYGLGVMPKPAA